MKQLLHKAITAALHAGKAILEIYHSGAFDIEIKGRQLSFNPGRYSISQCDYVLPRAYRYSCTL